MPARKFRNRQGATTVEYLAVAYLIVAGAVCLFTLFQPNLHSKISQIENSLDSRGNSVEVDGQLRTGTGTELETELEELVRTQDRIWYVAVFAVLALIGVGILYLRLAQKRHKEKESFGAAMRSEPVSEQRISTALQKVFSKRVSHEAKPV